MKKEQYNAIARALKEWALLSEIDFPAYACLVDRLCKAMKKYNKNFRSDIFSRKAGC